MEGVLKAALRIPERWSKRAAQQNDLQKKQALLAEIRLVCEQLHLTQIRFDQICDADLVDACIYEMEALRARYRYLLGQAKAYGITGTPFRERT